MTEQKEFIKMESNQSIVSPHSSSLPLHHHRTSSGGFQLGYQGIAQFRGPRLPLSINRLAAANNFIVRFFMLLPLVHSRDACRFAALPKTVKEKSVKFCERPQKYG